MNTFIKVLVVALALMLCHANLFSQNKSAIDSLNRLYEQATTDTSRAKILMRLGDEFKTTNPDSFLFYYKKGLQLSEKSAHNDLIIKACASISELENQQSHFDTSTYYLQKIITICKATHDSTRLASSLKNLGINYAMQSNYSKALPYFIEALKIGELLDNYVLIGEGMMNVANIFEYLKDFKKALDYCKKGILLFESKQDSARLSLCYNNYANSLKELTLEEKSQTSFENTINGLDTCIAYYTKAISMVGKTNPKYYLAMFNTNIGVIHERKYDVYLENNLQAEAKKELEFSLASYKKAQRFVEELGSQYGIMQVYRKLAFSYNKQGNYGQALAFAHKSLEIAEQMAAIEDQYFVSFSLIEAYKGQKNYQKALDVYEKVMVLSDSLFNREKSKELMNIEAQYQNEKKQKEIEILEKDNLLNREKAQKQKIIIASILFGLGVLVFLITFVLRRLQITRKQKRMIEEKNELLVELNEEITAQSYEIEAQRDLVTDQKEEIEKIHKDLSQSIDYAQRLQTAILPDIRILNTLVDEHFIVFKPKDKVSGDFYWWAVVENHFVLAVADCTGHGVPGAFMSLLGISFLREIVTKEYMTKPSVILQRLRKEIIFTLKQKGESGEQKDGMDMALIAINIETLEMEFAGANNTCWIVTQSAENNGQLTLHELQPDKMPVSIYQKMDHFTNQTFQLKAGDCLYLSTDGYKDQFGGPNNKKFMIKQMKELIQEIAPKPMLEQEGILLNRFKAWKGSNDQIDDVTVLGFRI